jgi:hypothetical protein
VSRDDRFADYVSVADRVGQFYGRFPDGRLCTGQPPTLYEIEGRTFVAYHALAYRTPDDPLPGAGWAWEPVPGPTPFTRDSELQNAETAAWGRAIVALGFETKHLASADEVRRHEASGPPEVAGASPEVRREIRGLIGQLMQADPSTDWPALARARAGPEATLSAPGATELAAFLRRALAAARRPDPSDTAPLDSTAEAEAATAWEAAQRADDEARRRAHRDLALLIRDIENEGKAPPSGHANWTEFSRWLAGDLFEVTSRAELDAGQLQTLIETVDREAGTP